MPSDMDLYIGTINGYNNLITIATDDLQLGHNETINEEQQIQHYQFESPQDEFLQAINEATSTRRTNNREEFTHEENNKEELKHEENNKVEELTYEENNKKELTHEENNKEELTHEENKQEELTHEENKLLLTLLGITLGSIAIWIFN